MDTQSPARSSPDDSPITLDPPRLEHLCDLRVEVAPVIDAGSGPFGVRRVVPIIGGQVTGARMRGRVLPVGADFQLVTGDASPANHEKLLRGETVPPEEVYFSGQPRFETGDPRWAWLSDRQFVARGRRAERAVLLSMWLLA
ncbi:MAG: DUF3237 family protein [Burkholderiales bacterium]|nr:DUF3237 family protein [Burkholderiales bacterium]